MRAAGPRVIRLLPNGQAVVSTRGLCCVVVEPNTKVIRELVPRHRAEACAEAYNSIHPGQPARVITHAQLAARRRITAAK
jgi:hypothetical protein